MGGFSLTHWLILLAVVVVIFGTSKLKNAGKDLGQAIKGFKDAVKDETQTITETRTQTLENKTTISKNGGETVQSESITVKSDHA